MTKRGQLAFGAFQLVDRAMVTAFGAEVGTDTGSARLGHEKLTVEIDLCGGQWPTL